MGKQKLQENYNTIINNNNNNSGRETNRTNFSDAQHDYFNPTIANSR